MRALMWELHRRSPVLSATAWAHLALLAVMIAVAPFDSRTVMALNPWFKPMKFAASIAVYLFSVAWLVGYVSRPRWAVRTVEWGVSAVFVVEILAIVAQAARGTTSHWNNATTFDTTLWTAMSIGIQINFLLDCLLLVLLFRRADPGPRLPLWGARAGMLVFITLATASGLSMVFNGAHTVGAPDGGAGIPFLNWSTRAGDLRIAHLLGIHALQILLVSACLLQRGAGGAGVATRAWLFALFAFGYAAVGAWLYVHALGGHPLFPVYQR